MAGGRCRHHLDLLTRHFTEQRRDGLSRAQAWRGSSGTCRPESHGPGWYPSAAGGSVETSPEGDARASHFGRDGLAWRPHDGSLLDGGRTAARVARPSGRHGHERVPAVLGRACPGTRDDVARTQPAFGSGHRRRLPARSRPSSRSWPAACARVVFAGADLPAHRVSRPWTGPRSRAHSSSSRFSSS